MLQILVALILLGFLLWLVQQLPFLDPTMKKIICAVVILIVVLWLLTAFFPALWGPLMFPRRP
jgi:hypothetical protein